MERSVIHRIRRVSSRSFRGLAVEERIQDKDKRESKQLFVWSRESHALDLWGVSDEGRVM